MPPTNKVNTECIAFRLSPTMLAELDELCALAGLSRSDYLRCILAISLGRIGAVEELSHLC
jgi:hypothetical protein